jgi:Ca-activated chloride channel family protein
MVRQGLHVAGVSLLSLAMVGASPASALPPPGDGVATPAACEALGFRSSLGGDVVVSGARPAPSRATVMNYAAPTGAPPPPPPPPPPPANMTPPPPLPLPPVQPRSAPAIISAAPRVPTDTERYPGAAANPVKRVAEEPVSTFSIDVDTAAYANTRRFLNDGAAPPRDAIRVEELINYFDYGYARPASAQTPFRATVAVAPSPWSKERQILHIGLQGYATPRADAPPLNLVFLVDTSGSMMGPDRLPLA